MTPIEVARICDSLFARRVKLYLKTEDSPVKLKSSSKISHGENVIELTMHGVTKFIDNVGVQVTAEELNSDYLDTNELIVGDCDYCYYVKDIERVEDIGEPSVNQMGAIISEEKYGFR